MVSTWLSGHVTVTDLMLLIERKTNRNLIFRSYSRNLFANNLSDNIYEFQGQSQVKIWLIVVKIAFLFEYIQS